MDTSILERIGLTPGEIKAYLALLRLGPSSTGPLAKRSGVSRSKLYSVMDKLEKKGLASHIEQGGVMRFQAIEPAKVRDYIREKEDDLRKVAEDFESLLPRLEDYRKGPGQGQSATLYQGMKGLIAAHEHTYLKLGAGEEYAYMGIPASQPESHHRYWQKDHERRIKAGIRSRLLFNRDTPRATLSDRNRFRGCDARYMPTDIKTPSYFLIYKDTVMIAIPSAEPLVVEITSKEIADSFMAYFEEFWSRSRPFTKKKDLGNKR